jgi:tetratricopeptide (TPR) repeat protein
LDLIQAARSKILNSLEIQPEDPDTWYLYGSCLSELARYFSDENIYHQAIEKFQYGLSLTRHNPLLWYGLALAHVALGELTEQPVFFEKSVRYYSRAIEFSGHGFPQFWNDWGVALMRFAELTQEPSYAEMAIEKFEQALKYPIQNIEKEEMEWLYHYASTLDLLGDLKEDPNYFEKAIHILLQVHQLDPEYTQAHYALALAISHLAEITCDVELYHKAVDHFQLLSNQHLEDEMIYLDFGIHLINLALLIQDVHHPENSHHFYHQAEIHLMQAAALGNMQSYYQLAGLYALTNHYSQAMLYLERAQFFGVLPGIEELLHDEWLTGLREFPAFRQFINELSSQQSMDDK